MDLREVHRRCGAMLRALPIPDPFAVNELAVVVSMNGGGHDPVALE